LGQKTRGNDTSYANENGKMSPSKAEKTAKLNGANNGTGRIIMKREEGEAGDCGEQLEAREP